MPGGDRTGPRGRGPMTGRAAGYCAGYGIPGYADAFLPGRGFGYGFSGGRRGRAGNFGGGGRGWRHMFYATGLPGWARSGGRTAPYENVPPYPAPDREAERQSLRSEAEFLQSELDMIKKRLTELETTTEG